MDYYRWQETELETGIERHRNKNARANTPATPARPPARPHARTKEKDLANEFLELSEEERTVLAENLTNLRKGVQQCVCVCVCARACVYALCLSGEEGEHLGSACVCVTVCVCACVCTFSSVSSTLCWPALSFLIFAAKKKTQTSVPLHIYSFKSLCAYFEKKIAWELAETLILALDRKHTRALTFE
jgi:hypothetical protein